MMRKIPGIARILRLNSGERSWLCAGLASVLVIVPGSINWSVSLLPLLVLVGLRPKGRGRS